MCCCNSHAWLHHRLPSTVGDTPAMDKDLALYGVVSILLILALILVISMMLPTEMDLMDI